MAVKRKSRGSRKSRRSSRPSRRHGNMDPRAHVKTDRKWHDFVYRYDVPPKVLKSEFDWISSDEVDHFFKYHGWWYHLSQFERLPSESPLAADWDGFQSTSVSTGDLIKVSTDGEKYKIGSVYYTSS